MTQLFQNLLTASFHGSIVILAVIALRLVLKKAPKKFLCFLWLLAGIRLLMPFEIQSDLSLQPEPAPIMKQIILDVPMPSIPENSHVQPVMPEQELPISEQTGEQFVPAPTEILSPAETVTIVESGPYIDWETAIPYIWLIVACCFLIYTLYSYIRLKLLVREAVKIEGGWECDRIETAFILGFIRPQIYIPMGLSKVVRKHILAHEQTHLEKGDHWFKMVGFISLALHWFNPLVWVAYILLCKDIEMACDERVVQFMELQERKEYSAALLNCSANHAHFAACPVAFGEVSVKHRITSVLKYKKPSFWISLAGVIAILFVALCLVTSPVEEAEPVIVEVPVDSYTPNTPDEVSDTVARVQNAWNATLSEERYHLFFADETFEGSVGWQVNVYKDGENTLWSATDHLTDEGHMVLDGIHYKFIDGNDGGWVPYEENDTLLDSMLEQFNLDGKVITDISSKATTNEDGYAYEKLTFKAHFTNDAGETVTQPMTVYFDTDGIMTGMRVENTDRKGADIFSFTNFGVDSPFNNIDDVYRIAKEKIIPIENVHPSKLQEPSVDEQRMKEWGILFHVDDDLLTRYGSEVWFAQAEDYDMTVHTDNAYWLEKKTDTGWEKLEPITEPKWNAASYTLAHGKYTMVAADWSEIYGPLPGGTYRMGKKFEMTEGGGQSCSGYAEFEIYYNEATTTDQTAAVERCYAELDELNKRDHLHWKSVMGRDSESEHWLNGEDYLEMRTWNGPDVPKDQWSQHDLNLFPRTDTSVRYDGIGYEAAHENPEVLSSKVIGMQLSTLSVDQVGWSRSTFKDDFNYGYFTRSNHTITFPEGVGIVSDEVVRFVQTWSVVGMAYDEASSQLTYKFDKNGDLCYMEYKSLTKGRNYIASIEIFDDSAEEIDAKIKPYTENLIVDTFSWNDAKAKYTDAEFNIRESNFVNNGGTPITGPVDAAKLALKEYPNLGDYLSMDVFRDDTTGMWKVTIEAYVDYQSTYAYRDVYLSDSGATQLLVYEGPVKWDEERK